MGRFACPSLCPLSPFSLRSYPATQLSLLGQETQWHGELMAGAERMLFFYESWLETKLSKLLLLLMEFQFPTTSE